MKYIRTKDGKIYNKSKIICSAFREEYCSPNWNEDIEKYLQTKIVAEADTIEELCDGFYLELDTIPINERFFNYDRANEEFVGVDIFVVYKTSPIFQKMKGFIKTDKGLIYVAKMNEKGELELL